MTLPRTARPRAVVGLAATVALVAGAVVTVTALPAQADESIPQCTDSFPVSDLVQDQEAALWTTVKGRNVTKLKATYVDTLDDGIGRGRDMLLFRVSGDPVDTLGIWRGMSGSPVVAADGRLIGALAYGFNDGNDTLAGITPADDLKSVKGWQPDTVSLQSARPALKREGVTVTASDRLHKVGLVRQVSGLSSSQLPLAKRLAQRAGIEASGLETGGTAGDSSTVYPVGAGGPVAASVSYGDVTLASTGTATSVCENGDVFAFGHADEWLGDTTQSLHGASVAAISRGSTSAMLANLGAPVGTVLQDRLEGLYGRLGQKPALTVDLTSRTTFAGKQIDGASKVTEQGATSYVVALQAASDALAAMNSQATGGESLISWKIGFTRENGRTGTFTRSQRYSSSHSLAEQVVSDVAGDTEMLLGQDFEKVTITSVDITNNLSKSYRAYRIGSVHQKIGNSLRRLRDGGQISVQRGKRIVLKLTLVRADKNAAVPTTTRWVIYNASRGADAMGELEISGNAYDWDDEDDYEDFEELAFDGSDDDKEDFSMPSPEPTTLDQLLAQAAKQPRQDDVSSSLGYLSRSTGDVKVLSRTVRTPAVVTGDYTFRVRFR